MVTGSWATVLRTCGTSGGSGALTVCEVQCLSSLIGGDEFRQKSAMLDGPTTHFPLASTR